ncbi:hypothetical protein P7_069 [Pectobacterium phage vB_PcaM_P7_Pc]|nr:hypothetical protein P7_069 [Pectobacterium phage vB_PcaM_P7_Pc]
MSRMRLTVGVIAQLVQGYGNYNQPTHEEFQEKLETMGSPLRLTYGGDMIVFIESDKRPDYDDPCMMILDEDIMQRFGRALLDADIRVYSGTPKVFIDHWYDGVDPPHIDISLEDAGYEEEEE